LAIELLVTDDENSDFKLSQTLADSKNLINWIIENLEDLEISKNEINISKSVILYDMAIEHFFGIVHLIDANICGSAFALLRAETEALVRGGWLQFAATESQIEALVNGNKYSLPVFKVLVESIKSVSDFSDINILELINNSWSAMNSFTHGGALPIKRRMVKDVIQPNYEPEVIIEVLKMSGSLALIALRQISRNAGNSELAKEVDKMLTGKINT
jgi:hypothetical protein